MATMKMEIAGKTFTFKDLSDLLAKVRHEQASVDKGLSEMERDIKILTKQKKQLAKALQTLEKTSSTENRKELVGA